VRGTNSTTATLPQVEVPEACIKEECNNTKTSTPRRGGRKCFNIEVTIKEEEDKTEEEIDIDPRAEFEPMTLV